jgi:hypothetical protein
VQLYVAPIASGGGGPRMPVHGRSLLAALHEQQTRPLGPDVLIEGYVHRPH